MKLASQIIGVPAKHTLGHSIGSILKTAVVRHFSNRCFSDNVFQNDKRKKHLHHHLKQQECALFDGSCVYYYGELNSLTAGKCVHTHSKKSF